MVNKSLVVGVIAGIVVGAGVMHLGFPQQSQSGEATDVNFATQSFTDNTVRPDSSRNEGGAGDIQALVVKYGIDQRCSVEFDDGREVSGTTSTTANGTQCCKIEGHSACYTNFTIVEDEPVLDNNKREELTETTP